MKWREIDKERPVYGSLIWVWDMNNNDKFLIRYYGSKESWLYNKQNSQFPIWAPLNEG